MKYEIYACDVETTGIDVIKNDVIELSLIRLSNNEQKTWHIKPKNPDEIQAQALKINGHKREDLLHITKYGKDTYKEADSIIIEIENWINSDGSTTDNRVLLAHNVMFDYSMIQNLWSKCNASDTFPFGRRTLDTMILEFSMNLVKGEFLDSYSLHSLCKKYDVKNSKAHTAEADTKVMKDIFDKQIAYLSKKMNA